MLIGLRLVPFVLRIGAGGTADLVSIDCNRVLIEYGSAADLRCGSDAGLTADWVPFKLRVRCWLNCGTVAD